MKKQAVLSLSGGMDSSTVLLHLLANNYEVTAVSFNYGQKHNIDPANIDTHFALLKRTAKSNKVEIFKVTSGNKKVENSLKLLNKAVYNIESGNFVKNKLSCTAKFGCEFYNTKHCSR